MTHARRITRAAELTSLPVIREFMRAGLADAGITSPLADDLVVAVEEAAMNIVTHGYEGMDPGSLMVELEVDPARVVVTLTDFGHQFEPAEPPTPDVQAIVEGAPERGFGLHLIHQIMDDVDYRCDELGNHLLLVKRR